MMETCYAWRDGSRLWRGLCSFGLDRFRRGWHGKLCTAGIVCRGLVTLEGQSGRGLGGFQYSRRESRQAG